MDNQCGNKLFPCQARVQFLACKNEIVALIQSGNSISEIHRILTKSNKISMGYRTLSRHVKEEIIDCASSRKSAYGSISNIRAFPLESDANKQPQSGKKKNIIEIQEDKPFASGETDPDALMGG